MADAKIKYPEVGQRIRELREMRGFEQLDIANQLGYKSQSTISKWESRSEFANWQKTNFIG